MGKAASFWGYIREREKIRLARLSGQPWPWTSDPILQKYKFTNVKRLHDRTTQAFLATYQEHVGAQAEVALLNCAIRRFFGTAEFSATLGWQEEFNPEALRAAERDCTKPWTGAYIIRAGGKGNRKVDSVIEYMTSLWAESSTICDAIDNSGTWEAGYKAMRACFGFGPFMAKEVLQDYILWLGLCGFSVSDAETFTPVGPGAMRGLNRLSERWTDTSISESAAQGEIKLILACMQAFWVATFPEAERLTAHDIQFCLCEFDKYQRALLGEGKPKATYKRSAT